MGCIMRKEKIPRINSIKFYYRKLENEELKSKVGTKSKTNKQRQQTNKMKQQQNNLE